jgi:transposase
VDGESPKKIARLSRDEMEKRRFAAARRILAGDSIGAIAREFNVDKKSVYEWVEIIHERGMEGLRKRRATGRPPFLDPSHYAELREIYEAGPRSVGFNIKTDHWTNWMIQKLIEEKFGVKYTPECAGKLLIKLGIRSKRAKRPISDNSAAKQS